MKMTQKQKIALLLKDLCARLLYGVKVKTPTLPFCMDAYVDVPIGELFCDGSDICIKYQDCEGKYITVSLDWFMHDLRPYLRPMSSMTEEEKEELKREFCIEIRDEDNGMHTEEYGYVMVYHNFKVEFWYIPYEAIDWLNAHYFDYRGLIEKSLALEAPEGMYK